MRRSERYKRGQMAVVMTFAMATLLGAMALCTDVAVLYYNWVQLQKGADAAALAGAGQYGPHTPPAPTCEWSAGSSAAQDAACDYALKNGIKKSEIVRISAPALSLPANSYVPPGGQTVQVLSGARQYPDLLRSSCRIEQAFGERGRDCGWSHPDSDSDARTLARRCAVPG